MEKSNQTAKLISVLLLGTIVGGALGYVLAPRKTLSSRPNKKGRNLAEAMEKRFKRFLKEVEKAKNNSMVLVESGLAKAEELKLK